MKCYFCDNIGAICFSTWPDEDNLCLCEKHITDAHLFKIQRMLKAKSQTIPSFEEIKKMKRAS
jgi:hypothetical protein